MMLKPATRSAFVALGATVLVATAAACSTTSDGKPEDRTFAFGGGSSLTIDARATALELVPVDRETNDIKVTRWFKAEKWNGETSTDWDMENGDTLVFRTNCSGVIVDCDTRHRVEVPRGLDITVRQHDGSVRAAGFTSKLDIETHDGSIRLKDAAGTLTLRSHDGSIHATGLTASRVSAIGRDAGVELDFTRAPRRVTADTRDGSISMTVPRGEYRVETEARDGNASVGIPTDDTSSRRINARAEDGSVTINPR